MSAIIIYMSLHGCAEMAAKQLAGMYYGKTDLVNLKNKMPPALDTYDTVIIGGSIHMGQIQGKIRKFCSENEDELLTKRLGIYLCHMYEGKEAIKQFNGAFSEKLREKAVAKGLFGGEFNFDRMNSQEKELIQRTAGLTDSLSRVNRDAITGFGRVIFHLDKS